MFEARENTREYVGLS